MQHLEVSGAVRHIYVIRRLKVKYGRYSLPEFLEVIIYFGTELLFNSQFLVDIVIRSCINMSVEPRSSAERCDTL